MQWRCFAAGSCRPRPLAVGQHCSNCQAVYRAAGLPTDMAQPLGWSKLAQCSACYVGQRWRVTWWCPAPSRIQHAPAPPAPSRQRSGPECAAARGLSALGALQSHALGFRVPPRKHTLGDACMTGQTLATDTRHAPALAAAVRAQQCQLQCCRQQRDASQEASHIVTAQGCTPAAPACCSQTPAASCIAAHRAILKTASSSAKGLAHLPHMHEPDMQECLSVHGIVKTVLIEGDREASIHLSLFSRRSLSSSLSPGMSSCACGMPQCSRCKLRVGTIDAAPSATGADDRSRCARQWEW